MDMNQEKSIFEKIIDREIPSNILMENEAAIVIEDINPKAPVHVLIIPKKRIDRVSMANDDDVEILGKLLLTAKKFAEQENITDGFRLVINNGKNALETVPHLHIHFLAGRKMKWPPC